MGTILLEMSGRATAMPPTAEVTDTAGVNTPSAIQRAVPNKVWDKRARLAVKLVVQLLRRTHTHGSNIQRSQLFRFSLRVEVVLDSPGVSELYL